MTVTFSHKHPTCDSQLGLYAVRVTEVTITPGTPGESPGSVRRWRRTHFGDTLATCADPTMWPDGDMSGWRTRVAMESNALKRRCDPREDKQQTPNACNTIWVMIYAETAAFSVRSPPMSAASKHRQQKSPSTIPAAPRLLSPAESSTLPGGGPRSSPRSLAPSLPGAVLLLTPRPGICRIDPVCERRAPRRRCRMNDECAR